MTISGKYALPSTSAKAKGDMKSKIMMMGALVGLCIAGPAFAEPDRETFAKQLDGFIESEIRAEQVPGVAIAVLRKGEIVVAKGYGKATVELDVPVTTDTIFQSGSVGKMFTAAAVMLQVEQGRIGLDEPVGKYLAGVPASWQAITIRQMLTHTSGIPDFYGSVYDYRRDYSDDDLVKLAYTLPLDFKPGARWSYSNTAYVLLGIIVKKVTGKSYLEILDAQVFKPLGMKTARGLSDRDIVPNRASGYQLIDGALKNQDWVSVANPTADGSLYVSLKDMIEWARGVEKGEVLNGGSWKQVYTPVRLNSGKSYPYGFGWRITEAGGHPRYSHSGAWQGFRTFYSRYLGDDLSVILLSNAAHTHLNTIMDGIAKLWDPALVASGPSPKPEPAAERHLRTLIETVQAGKLRAEDVPLAVPGTAEAANAEFGPMLKALGPLTKLELAERREEGDDIVYTYTAMFGSKRVTVHFGVGPGNQASNFMVMS